MFSCRFWDMCCWQNIAAAGLNPDVYLPPTVAPARLVEMSGGNIPVALTLLNVSFDESSVACMGRVPQAGEAHQATMDLA